MLIETRRAWSHWFRVTNQKKLQVLTSSVWDYIWETKKERQAIEDSLQVSNDTKRKYDIGYRVRHGKFSDFFVQKILKWFGETNYCSDFYRK